MSLTEIELNWLALSIIPQVSNSVAQKMLLRYKDINNIVNAPLEELSNLFKISPSIASKIKSCRQLPAFQDELTEINSKGVDVITFGSTNYPDLLKQISAPPMVLYLEGRFKDLKLPSLAVVGSRNCSVYGIRHTRRLILELKELLGDLVIVSGLAKGIDKVAHQTALEAGLKTVAVLAGGLNYLYPTEHYELAEEVKKNGALLSEFSMNQKPIARNFPIRNRVISGISKGVLIIEAAIKSGAMITAKAALNQNKEVFALPGSVDGSMSLGPHHLISSSQAKLVQSATDIIEDLFRFGQLKSVELSLPMSIETETIESSIDIVLGDLESNKALLINELAKSMLDADSLCAATKMDINTLLGLLVELEIEGLVESYPGQKYKLCDGLRLS